MRSVANGRRAHGGLELDTREEAAGVPGDGKSTRQLATQGAFVLRNASQVIRKPVL
ncbi:MAG: hypothetical protein ABSD67_07350 [Terracidiphilus sp.]